MFPKLLAAFIALFSAYASSSTLSDTIWLTFNDETNPELAMWFLPGGIFRSCVWLDEERLQTDFGNWSLSGDMLRVELTRQGTGEYQVLAMNSQRLTLSTPDRNILLHATNRKTQHRCLPILESWNKLARHDQDDP